MSPEKAMNRRRAAILLVVLTVSGVGALYLGRSAVHEEVEQSSDFCVSCHSHSAEHLGGHAELACAQCHTVQESSIFLLWFAEVRGSSEAPDHGSVSPSTCTTCHQRNADAWSQLSTSTGHAGHSGLVTCTQCHDSSLHGAKDAGGVCTSCHAALTSNEPTAVVACTSCHVFAAAPAFVALGDQDRRRPDTALGGHAAVDATRLHGTVECGRCHNPHLPNPTGHMASDCRTCHRVNLPEQVAGGPAGHQNCRGCHDVHGPGEQPASECIQCHRMPGSRRGTRWAVSPTPVPEAERVVLRETISHGAQCQRCHRPHTWVADAHRCAECHEEKVESIARMPANSHGDCLGCHDPHRAPPTASICRNCHEDKVRAARAARPAPHRDCTSCHDPHQPRPEANRVCGSCHAEPHNQLGGQPERHRDCISCHDPHGNPREGARTACTTCHAQESQSLSRARNVPAQHQCANCHIPHRFAPKSNALIQCNHCHQQPSAHNSNHHGPCTNCHTPHEAPLGRAPNCRGCHEEITPAVRGHQQCNRCHVPHRSAVAALGQCQSCHASQVRALASWPAESPHHGRCERCHTPHEEGHIEPCATCHRDHQNPQHMGAHPQCTGCHTPHRPVPPNNDWQSRCGDCHRDQAAGVATSTGTHTRCKNCHEVPGPPLPTCQGCHENQATHLLHSVAQHATCSDCHADHSNAPPTRASCTHCHRERQNHFPDADTCQRCHPFRLGAPTHMPAALRDVAGSPQAQP